MTDDLAIYEHYARLIESLLPPGGPAFEPVAEDDSTIQVERGIVLPLAVCRETPDRSERLVERLVDPGGRHPRVVDGAGHARTGYTGLLVYAWRRSMTAEQWARWRKPLQRWCPTLYRFILYAWPRSTSQVGFVGGVSAAGGAAWAALAMQAGGWAQNATRVFGRLVEAQDPGGAFVRRSPSDNPETAWYHELVLLHAAAARVEDAACVAAAARNAEYHLNETQPDHATNEPWGLLAFIRNPSTHSVADQMLHTVRVQYPNGAQGVTAILLADVLDKLRELRRPRG